MITQSQRICLQGVTEKLLQPNSSNLIFLWIPDGNNTTNETAENAIRTLLLEKGYIWQVDKYKSSGKPSIYIYQFSHIDNHIEYDIQRKIDDIKNWEENARCLCISNIYAINSIPEQFNTSFDIVIQKPATQLEWDNFLSWLDQDEIHVLFKIVQGKSDIFSQKEDDIKEWLCELDILSNDNNNIISSQAYDYLHNVIQDSSGNIHKFEALTIKIWIITRKIIEFIAYCILGLFVGFLISILILFLLLAPKIFSIASIIGFIVIIIRYIIIKSDNKLDIFNILKQERIFIQEHKNKSGFTLIIVLLFFSMSFSIFYPTYKYREFAKNQEKTLTNTIQLNNTSFDIIFKEIGIIEEEQIISIPKLRDKIITYRFETKQDFISCKRCNGTFNLNDNTTILFTVNDIGSIEYPYNIPIKIAFTTEGSKYISETVIFSNTVVMYKYIPQTGLIPLNLWGNIIKNVGDTDIEMNIYFLIIILLETVFISRISLFLHNVLKNT